ncbi:hypothetical protein PHAGEALMA_185 [Escherichia phage vB_Eco_Alma]|nr:hypothetical protein PHAGEALMA_185 [Escherichia phage vB_Eco_Alma]
MKRLDQLKLVQYMAYRVLEVQKGSKKRFARKLIRSLPAKKMTGCYARPKRLTSWGISEEEIRLEEQEEIRRSEADYQAAWENWMSNK